MNKSTSKIKGDGFNPILKLYINSILKQSNIL